MDNQKGCLKTSSIYLKLKSYQYWFILGATLTFKIEEKCFFSPLRRLAPRGIANGNGGFETTFSCRKFSLLSENLI